jgi:hypothetical protein
MRWIVLPLVLSAAALLTAAGVLLATEKREAGAAPDYRVVRAGGIEYESMLARPIRPENAVDRQIVKGLSAADRRRRGRTLLFGAFVAVTNDSSRAVRTAHGIVLRDESNRDYQSLSLPASNAYAYRPRVISPNTRLPSVGSPADSNLAATGFLLLYRIPAEVYENGVLELVIHDPLHPDHTVSLAV